MLPLKTKTLFFFVVLVVKRGKSLFAIGLVTGEVPCTSEAGWSAAVDLNGELEGELAITVNFSDIAGNGAMQIVGQTIKDTINPSVSLDSSPLINGASVRAHTIEGECSEVGQAITVVLGDGTTQVGPDTEDQITCNSNQRWMASFDTTDLNDGSVTITVNHRDVAQNLAMQLEQSINKDIYNPQLLSGDIGVPGNDLYIGGALDFMVYFNENIIVNIDSGVPRIALLVGSSTRYASYISGSGSNQLVFRYVIQTGDQDSDGIAFVGSSYNIDLNNGVIGDIAGNLFSGTALSVPNLDGITVDGRAPTLNAIAVATPGDADSYYGPGESVTLAATFSKVVTITGTPELLLDVGGIQRTASYTGNNGVSATTHNFIYTVGISENDTDGIAVTGIGSHTNIVDADSNHVAAELAPVLGVGNVIVDTLEPTIVDLESDTVSRMDKTWNWRCDPDTEFSCEYRFVINEESTYQFSSDDEYGDTHTASAQSSLNGDYYIHVQAIDVVGNESSIMSASVTLDNVASIMLISSVGIPESRIYTTNEGINFMIEFDDEVIVDTTNGTPRLVLSIGGEDRYANYFSGSGTTEIIFRHIIRMGDEDNDGIAFSNNSNIDLNGGNIWDEANNNAVLTDLASVALGEIRINSMIPVLEEVAIESSSLSSNSDSNSSTNYYNLGDIVTLTASFSELVTITGAPSLVLGIGNLLANASYVGEEGASATSHNFIYTVGDNENDSDGIFATDISLHRMIVDSDNNSVMANVSPAIEVANMVVDTNVPTVSTSALIEVSGHNLFNYPVTGLCNEEGTIRTSVVDTSLETMTTCDGQTWNANLNVASVPEGDMVIAVSLEDFAGNFGNASNVSIAKGAFRSSYSLQKLGTGYGHICVLNSDKRVLCWGPAIFSVLGNSQDSTDALYPIAVHEGSSGTGHLGNIVQISVGEAGYHSCALTTSGEVKCWGHGGGGRLGNGRGDHISYPTSVLASNLGDGNLNGVVQLSTGGNHTCALMSTGQVKCWGAGILGTRAQINLFPGTVLSARNGTAFNNVIQIDTGYGYTCAVTILGEVKCWGIGYFGQLGDGDLTVEYYPKSVIEGEGNTTSLNRIIQVSAGSYHACALTATGEVRCWGLGNDGQLGNDALDTTSYPVTVVSSEGSTTPLSGIVQISSGGYHTCALTVEGTVKCWGRGSSGQLGHDSRTGEDTPATVVAAQRSSAALSNIIEIRAGEYYTCALTSLGEVKCWGGSTDRRYGVRSDVEQDYPVSIFADEGRLNYLDIGSYHGNYSCLIGGNDCSLNNITLTFAGNAGPSGNSSSVSIVVSGIAPNETVSIYRDAFCTSDAESTSTDGGSVNFTGLEEGEHRFYYKASTGDTSSNCSPNFLPYVLDQTAPITLGIVLLTSSPGTDNTPVIEVSRTQAGSLIKIYSDSSCSGEVMETIRIDSSGQESFAIELPVLDVGTYHFYAQAIDRAGNTSDCSTSSGEYVLSLPVFL